MGLLDIYGFEIVGVNRWVHGEIWMNLTNSPVFSGIIRNHVMEVNDKLCWQVEHTHLE